MIYEKFKNCNHRRVAGISEGLFSSFAAERAPNENPQPIRGGFCIPLQDNLERGTLNL
jgi:hypothetical protein